MRALGVTLAGLILALALGACGRAVAPVTSDDVSMGNAGAKVTVIEYASVACPVCAQWSNDNFAAFKKTYVDSGRVRYVLREALTHNPAIAAAGFALARCAGQDKYFDVIDALYKKRDAIEASPSPHDELLAIARANGMSDEQFQACISDAKTLNAIQTRWNTYSTRDKIENTPTFVINGKMLIGGVPLSELDQAISDAEKAPAKP